MNLTAPGGTTFLSVVCLAFGSNSVSAKDFIRKLLVLDPRHRMTAKQAMHHPFIVQNCPETTPTILAAEMAAHSISTSAPTVNPIHVSPVASSNPFDRVSSARQETKGKSEVVGRPLGNKTPLDDSGCVTSNETLAREKMQTHATATAHTGAAGLPTAHDKSGKKPSIFGHKVSGITNWFAGRTGKSSHKLDRP